MNSKDYVIRSLEEPLEHQEGIIKRETENIRGLDIRKDETEKEIAEAGFRIAGLKDALHKLKGLDNLEKKNKIADPVGSVHPDYVISQGIKIGPLYDALQNEAKRRGE